MSEVQLKNAVAELQTADDCHLQTAVAGLQIADDCQLQTDNKFQLASTKDLQIQNVDTSQVHDASGRHLLLTLGECKPDLLNDEQALRDLIVLAAEASGATVLGVSSHKFQPQGVTALALLAESHASLHTYPEASLVFWDCFTCGTTCDPELSIKVLAEALGAKIVSSQVVYRS